MYLSSQCVEMRIRQLATHDSAATKEVVDRNTPRLKHHKTSLAPPILQQALAAEDVILQGMSEQRGGETS